MRQAKGKITPAEAAAVSAAAEPNYVIGATARSSPDGHDSEGQTGEERQAIWGASASRDEVVLDQVDRRLLTLLQKDFPLVPRPFLHLGQLLDLGEEEVLARVSNLKAKKIIRRLGGVFNTRGLGFASTLVALQVRPEHLERVAERVNAYPGVTHNYARSHPFNLWFTLITRERQELEEIVAEIKTWEGVLDLLVLPARRIFKIGVKLDLVREDPAPKEE